MLTKQYIQRGKHNIEYYVIQERRFKVKDTWFEIVSSTVTGAGPHDMIHSVRGPGGVKEMTHRNLINVWLKN